MIRLLESKDIDRVMDIWIESTVKAHDFIDKSYWEENYDAVKNIYIPMGETLVFEENNEIKGFISILNNEFIGALFVDSKLQGYGVGKKLIEYSIDTYKNLKLHVYKDNKKALNFYLKRGFEIVSEEVNEDTKKIEYVMISK